MILTRESYKQLVAEDTMKQMSNALAYARQSEPKMIAMAEAFFALQEAGVIEATEQCHDWTIRYGYNVEVKTPEMWGKIHKVVGKLICSNKEPVGDGRSQRVKVTMTPEKWQLQYNFKFTFEKKLDKKKDKCKIVTTREKVTRVVCNV